MVAVAAKMDYEFGDLTTSICVSERLGKDFDSESGV